MTRLDEQQQLAQVNDAPIQLHPEIERFAAENDVLREELAAPLVEAHDLVQTV